MAIYTKFIRKESAMQPRLQNLKITPVCDPESGNFLIIMTLKLYYCPWVKNASCSRAKYMSSIILWISSSVTSFLRLTFKISPDFNCSSIFAASSRLSVVLLLLLFSLGVAQAQQPVGSTGAFSSRWDRRLGGLGSLFPHRDAHLSGKIVGRFGEHLRGKRLSRSADLLLSYRPESPRGWMSLVRTGNPRLVKFYQI